MNWRTREWIPELDIDDYNDCLEVVVVDELGHKYLGVFRYDFNYDDQETRLIFMTIDSSGEADYQFDFCEVKYWIPTSKLNIPE